MDACIATDTNVNAYKKADVLVTVSNENAYDGYVSRDFPTDLRRKFIAIRKKDSSEVIGNCRILIKKNSSSQIFLNFIDSRSNSWK